ncbi:MAG: hypothetical protein RL490_1449 [Pseudomonadota bacterium]
MAKKWEELSTKEKISGGCFSVFALFVVVIGISIFTGGGDKPTSMATLDKGVSEVIVSNGFLNVQIDMSQQYSGNSAIYGAADTVRKAISVLQSGATDAKLADLKGATFAFSVPTKNSLGEESKGDLINIVIDGDKLRRAKPDKMFASDILEVARTDLPTPMAVNSAQEYCDESAKLSPRFCAGVDMTRIGGKFVSPNS